MYETQRARSQFYSRMNDYPLTKKDIMNQVSKKIHYYLQSEVIPIANVITRRKAPRSPSRRSRQMIQSRRKSTKSPQGNSQDLLESRKRSIRSPGRRSRQAIEPYSFAFSDPKELIEFSPTLLRLIQTELEEKNIIRLLQISMRLIVNSIENGWIGIMAAAMTLSGWLFQQVKEHELSIYMFLKCMRYSSVMNLDIFKAQSLIGIGKNFRLLNRYDESMRCLKKGLQYLWRCGRRHSEAVSLQISVYQEMSYCLLHTNEIQLSQYYRNRFQRGTVESKNSNVIKLSNDILYTYERHRIVLKKLTPNISIMIGVDFIDIDKQVANLRKTHLNSGILTNVLQRILDVNFSLVLDGIMNEAEFKEDIPLPNDGSNQKIFAEIDSYIERKHKQKFISPIKKKKHTGLDQFERNSNNRQSHLKKDSNVFSTEATMLKKSQSVSGTMPVIHSKAVSTKIYSKTKLREYFESFMSRVRKETVQE